MPAAGTTPTPQLSLALALLMAFSLSLVFALFFLSLTAVGVVGLGWHQVSAFTQAAHTTPAALFSQGLAGLLQKPLQTSGRKNILILGTDSLKTRGDAPPLTDSIMIASINLQSGQISLLSFPRDLWSEKHSSRINTLYWLGLQQQKVEPSKLVTDEITNLTQIPIHHTILLSLESVAELIDLVGGIEVEVKTSFIDTAFPRTDVDVTIEKDPSKLYQTVEFKAGKQHLDGATALQFMRSRKSSGIEGNDGARVQRQQLVIESLLKSLLAKKQDLDLHFWGELYDFYTQNLSQYLPVTEVISTGRVVLPVADTLTFSSKGLSLFPAEQKGVIYHPNETTTQGAWVYKVKDLSALQNEVRIKLDIP